jgi:mono/diheme cytochrome c family protein
MDLPERNRLSFGGFVQHSRIAVAILQSLRFKSGDTTKNGQLTVDRFTASFPRTGKSLFQGNCSYCHYRNRVLIGPALTPELMNHLGNDSIYRFLTHRSPTPDSNGLHCREFRDWSKSDIDKIVSYLKN